MKVPKMKEVYQDYMNILLTIYVHIKKVIFVRSKRYIILPALILEGFVAVDIFEGACDRKRFVDFILDKVVNNNYYYTVYLFILYYMIIDKFYFY